MELRTNFDTETGQPLRDLRIPDNGISPPLIKFTRAMRLMAIPVPRKLFPKVITANFVLHHGVISPNNLMMVEGVKVPRIFVGDVLISHQEESFDTVYSIPSCPNVYFKTTIHKKCNVMYYSLSKRKEVFVKNMKTEHDDDPDKHEVSCVALQVGYNLLRGIYEIVPRNFQTIRN